MLANTLVAFQLLGGEGCALKLMCGWTVGMFGERVSYTGTTRTTVRPAIRN